MKSDATMRELGARLRRAREHAGLEVTAVEDRLMLGPGWISRIESGSIVPPLDMLLAIASHVDAELTDLFRGLLPAGSERALERHLYAEADGADLLLHFRYAQYDAVYKLPNATSAQFELVMKVLRDGLSDTAHSSSSEAEAAKAKAVADTFLKCVEIWPSTNASDLWWFLVYRAYCDPFNHPAEFARLDLPQSWKRTAGWALEQILVRFYGPFLRGKRIEIEIAHGSRKEHLLSQLTIEDRLEPDKVDVLLTGKHRSREFCFGVVHVKASFAERRTDDVPLSRALIRAGYTSPLWTMDCKSMPSEEPFNKGELGVAMERDTDRRSAKRRDIEDDAYFSACFSYNQNTVPTPRSQRVQAAIIVCDFDKPDDAFSRFVVREWKRFRTTSTGAR